MSAIDDTVKNLHATQRVILEFLGQPGAGKTRLSREVASRLRGLGLSVDEVTYRIATQSALARFVSKGRYVVTELAMHPCRTQKAIRAILAKNTIHKPDGFKVLFNWLYISSVVTRVNSNTEVIVLDQGLFQAAWSIVYRAQNQRSADSIGGLIAEFLSGMDIPVLVVQLDVSCLQLEERIKERTNGRSPMDHESSRDFHKGYLALVDVTKLLKANVSRYSMLKHIVVDHETLRATAIAAKICVESIMGFDEGDLLCGPR